MTYRDIAAMAAAAAEAVGGAYTYRQFPPESAPEPPYVLFYYPGRDDFLADDRSYARVTGLRLELYTDNKDFTAEAAVETVLESSGMVYDKHESYIDEERMYQALYEMEVMIDAD